jgi:hypothetical protein
MEPAYLNTAFVALELALDTLVDPDFGFILRVIEQLLCPALLPDRPRFSEVFLSPRILDQAPRIGLITDH